MFLEVDFGATCAGEDCVVGTFNQYSASMNRESVEDTLRIEIVEANLDDVSHQQAVVELINAYAMDPMGNGRPLSAEVRNAVIPGLRQHPTTLVFLAYEGDEAVGIAVCFRGFSTFAGRPLVNIHDLAVLPSHRGKGIGRRLLEVVGSKASRMGCCKLTLEVLERNSRAKHLYASFGFAQAEYREGAGGSLFFVKPL